MAEIPNGYRSMKGSEKRCARGARRVGPADPNEKLFFTVRVRRKPNVSPAPDQNYWAANPPGKRQFLSREEVLARASAAQSDMDKVIKFAQSQGFQVVETSIARRTVRLSGTVEQANRAFAIDLGRYESPEESYRGREGAVNVPAELADTVEGVYGLDNRRMARRLGGGPPPGAVPVTPVQVATLYNFPTPFSAHGQTIGILEFGGGFAQSDLNLQVGASAPVVNLVSVDGQSTTTFAGSASSPNSYDQEVALDVQLPASIVSNANFVMFFAPFSDDGWIDAVTTAIYESPLRLTTLTISWGQSEDQWDSGTLNSLSLAFAEAALLGITIFSGSGDFGSNNQDNDGNAHVSYPASDPWVTACGGTFIANPTSIPFSEGTWNDFAVIKGTVVGGATGGGVSALPAVSAGGTGFAAPSWQNGLTARLSGSATSTPLAGRGVPDVAGNASPFSPYPITVYGQPFNVGGTSAVGPLYAALFAIIAAKAGWPIGFLNPLLYQIATTPKQTAIVPISDGANNELNPGITLPSGSAPESCPSFVATAGWNACTGLGRINGAALLNALILPEETHPINDEIPFSFGVGGEWLYHNDGSGSNSSGNSINAGQFNTSNIFDCTYVYNNSPNNAVFAADNQSTGNGAVGLFGRSRGSSWSIGVAGESVNGCAMYGIATGETPAQGIGVVGRSMNGIATETLPLEQVTGEPIGVLGHSAVGPGVRGHGGPLLKQPDAGLSLPSVEAAPGGSFSSGRLHDQKMPGAVLPQTVSLDSLAQLRLIPSTVGTLPAIARIGDLFLVFPPTPVGTTEVAAVAQLYLCTHIVKGVPQWQLVQLGAPLPGNSSI
jgi:kumamolisin